jgi:hypothetical protein
MQPTCHVGQIHKYLLIKGSESIKRRKNSICTIENVGRFTNGLYLPFIIQHINKITISGHTLQTSKNPVKGTQLQFIKKIIWSRTFNKINIS